MKQALILLGVILLLVVQSIIGCTAPSPTSPAPTAPTTQPPAEVIKFKGVTCLPKNLFAMQGMNYLAEQLPTRTNGRLTIEHLGGPEVVPAIDLADSVRKGVVDIALTFTSFHEGFVPVGNIPSLSVLTPEQEEKSGAMAYMNELHEKAGMHLLWRGAGTSKSDSFHIVTKNKISSSAEIAKLKMGGATTLLSPYMKSVGSGVIVVPSPEAYTALERGVVDAFCWPLQNSVDMAFYEVSKYVIEPAFMAGNAYYIVNLQKWNSLPKDLQDTLLAVAKEQRLKYQELYDKQIIDAKEKYKANGGEIVTLSDADRFFKAVYDASWAEEARRFPDVTPKLRALLEP